jgi:hypothetical protein
LPVHYDTCLPVHYTRLPVHYAIIQGFHKCNSGRCPRGTDSSNVQERISVLQKANPTVIRVEPAIKSHFTLLAQNSDLE